MKKTDIIHKQGWEKATKYAGFGQYVEIAAPLCVGAKALYVGKSYYIHRLWSNVTCKHCLKKRVIKSADEVYEETKDA